MYIILENEDQEKQDKGKESRLQKLKVHEDFTWFNFAFKRCNNVHAINIHVL